MKSIIALNIHFVVPGRRSEAQANPESRAGISPLPGDRAALI
jgi:hypothetical protein